MVAARLILSAATALVLAGCQAPQSGTKPDAGAAEARARKGLAAFFARPDQSSETPKAPLKKAGLAGGDVIVAGPDGYCIDPQTKRAGPERGFAVIASCHILNGGKTGAHVSPMLVTVTVGPRGDTGDLPTPQALALASEATLLDWNIARDRVSAHLDSGSNVMFEGADTRYWRGAFLQGERLVGLALYAPKGSNLADSGGAEMLGRVKDAIARNSASPQRSASQPRRPIQTGGFLGRLFNN
ncbi:dihydroxy-acid dehydratase [Antarctobacter jejuensis]|uniref:dihydroxy-acid dehydratase n=1 Tax=Antarctobacter jejuensis TaxID=1439938 RepID=UPI003FD17E34